MCSYKGARLSQLIVGPNKREPTMKNYAYAWITVAFFLVSIVLHWLFGWFAFVDDAKQHGQAVVFASYAITMARDTFENWQSEFLQLIWQVVGLAYFLVARPDRGVRHHLHDELEPTGSER